MYLFINKESTGISYGKKFQGVDFRFRLHKKDHSLKREINPDNDFYISGQADMRNERAPRVTRES